VNLEYFFSTFYVKCRVSAPCCAVLLFKFDLTQNLAYSSIYTALFKTFIIFQKLHFSTSYCNSYAFRYLVSNQRRRQVFSCLTWWKIIREYIPSSPYRGLLFLEFNSKIKLGDQLKKFNLKYWGIYNLNSVIISCVLKLLASQNRFQSLYDEIFNIDRFVE